MKMMEGMATDWEARRERECNRVAAQDEELDRVLDETLATLYGEDECAIQTREAPNKEKGVHAIGPKVEMDRQSLGKTSAAPTLLPSKTAEFDYPLLPLDMKGIDHSHLVDRLIELAMQFRRDKNYADIRDEFVGVSLMLNQFGLLAPAFRDQPRIPRIKSLWVAYTPLLIDQIVIDCHWVKCRGEKVSPKWPEIKVMFTPTGNFNCEEIAAKIAAQGWSSDFRADELMNLCERHQAQLVQLRGKVMKARFRALLDGDRELDETGKIRRVSAKVIAVRRAITNWIDGNHRVRGQNEIYESIWLAMGLLGPNALKAHIAELVGFRCGVAALHPRTITDKISKLQGVLARAGI